MSKILLLEDDEILGEIISDYLTSKSHECTLCKEYEKALNLAYELNFDLWIFDVKIIGGSGFELLKELRQSGKDTPCIFMTSLNTVDDLNKGFLSGCDDYLKKPFELKELIIRAENLIKRSYQNRRQMIKIDEIYSFDIFEKTLYKNDEVVNLSNKESILLALLLKNIDKIVSRDEIYSTLWDYDQTPSELSLRVYIRNLRKHLGDKIQSIPKIGYKIVC